MHCDIRRLADPLDVPLGAVVAAAGQCREAMPADSGVRSASLGTLGCWHGQTMVC
jgi:hypothetical protein